MGWPDAFVFRFRVLRVVSGRARACGVGLCVVSCEKVSSRRNTRSRLWPLPRDLRHGWELHTSGENSDPPDSPLAAAPVSAGVLPPRLFRSWGCARLLTKIFQFGVRD